MEKPMENEKKSPFRQKSLNKVAGPEQLDRYLKVTSYRSWFVVVAEALVVVAIFLWIFIGKIQIIANGAGICRDGKLVVYFSQSDAEEIAVGDVVCVDGQEFKVYEVNTGILRPREVPGDVGFLLPKVMWYSTVEARASLDDGFYPVKYYGEEISPITFMTEKE